MDGLVQVRLELLYGVSSPLNDGILGLDLIEFGLGLVELWSNSGVPSLLKSVEVSVDDGAGEPDNFLGPGLEGVRPLRLGKFKSLECLKIKVR